MPQNWSIHPQKKEKIEKAQDLVEQLLLNRGLLTKKEKEKFFHPKMEDFTQDLKIPGITRAKKRIKQAIQKGELVIVYGDYDVDGLCGTAILYLGLTSLGARVLPYIPHREKEGYGLSEDGLKFCLNQEAKLVITVDNGITAMEQANLAQKIGLDLIITDHHLPSKKIPQAQAIVHSTKMCGAAVAWCLIKEMIAQTVARELLDLVALATVCDLMILQGVNRVLVKEGLEIFKKTKRVGLLALMKVSGLEKENLSSFHLGSVLGPRLNAKGRLEHAMDGLRLLCTKDWGKAQKLARLLGETNEQRKQLVAEAVTEARMIIEGNKSFFSEKKILILSSENWLPGIVGLIAGRVSEDYGLPTIAIAQGETQSKGSARSVKGVDIVKIMRQHSNLLLDVGGHPQAAGFTLETEKIEIFKTKLEKTMEEIEVEAGNGLEIEAVVDLEKISFSWVDQMRRFEPFGVGNPQPVLASFGGELIDLRTVGNGQHLKGKASGVDFIAFGKGEMVDALKSSDARADIAYYLEIDRFNGSENLQLKVLEIKLA